MVADLRYFNSLEHEVDSLKSQLKTQKTQFLNEINRLSKEYYYADHMNAILGVYTTLDEFTDLQCDYVDQVVKCERTVKFRNHQIALILGYGDLVHGNITIKRVYYVEGLNHNLFSVGQLCDADLEVSFRKGSLHADLKGNDLLTGSRGTDLYSITLQYTSTPNPICLMAKASSLQAWLWHRRLSHLNFDIINLLSKYDIVNGLPKLKFIKDHLCSSCELGKAKHGIEHQMSTARTPEQNGVVKSQNRTLLKAARTMLSTAKVPLFFWAEAIATTCFTQNRSLYSVVTAADAPNQRQQQHTTPYTSTTVAADTPPLNIQATSETTSQAPTVTATENINQAGTNKEMHKLKKMNLSTSLVHRTRRQLEIDGEMCMFTLTVSQTKSKNIKEAMADSTWIKAMQEELHQFDQLDVWELVDRPLCKNVINM
ncbi:integrase, catalytic region, zinc finger, CCHC-type containing protein [Tanacetum coccineum]